MRSDWFELKAHVERVMFLTVLTLRNEREKAWNGGERIVAVGFWSGVGAGREGEACGGTSFRVPSLIIVNI